MIRHGSNMTVRSSLEIVKIMYLHADLAKSHLMLTRRECKDDMSRALPGILILQLEIYNIYWEQLTYDEMK